MIVQVLVTVENAQYRNYTVHGLISDEMGTGGALTLASLRSDRDISFKGVDLLTLSACETARGGGSEGEEIESFGALAQAKGASAVMATLWQIADQSTARLMAD